MRTAFANAVFDLAKVNKDIMLITNDLGYSVLEPFIEAYPNRYLNIGIAEQNMMSVAAGLAMAGKIPVVFSIIPFATLRCYEQVRDDVCLHNLNVKIVGAGSGLSYGILGPTHHSIEDLAVMRVLPNMKVVCPADPIETDLATRALIGMPGPAYLRIHKKGDPVIHSKKPRFKIGKAITITEGNDAVLIATGNAVPTALSVVERFRHKNIHIQLVSMHTIKPLDTEVIKLLLKKKSPVITFEEHSILGGLGGAVAEVMSELGSGVKLLRLGINDRFTLEVGSQNYLRKINKLDIDSVHLKIDKFLKRFKVT